MAAQSAALPPPMTIVSNFLSVSIRGFICGTIKVGGSAAEFRVTRLTLSYCWATK
jgi:hypothetical protein